MAGLDDPTQPFRLDGQTVIVTGASSGLGSRFARVAAAAGATVVLGARRQRRLEGLVAELRREGAEAVAAGCDVTVDREVKELVAGAMKSTGRLDVLVNAAGIAPREDEDIESPDLFRHVLEVNTVGLYSCTRAAAKVMLDRGAGSIVNIASISGLVAGDGLDTPSYTLPRRER